MEKQEILKRLDHTLLQQTAVWEQIKVLCDEGMEYGTASVCIPPSFVKRAKEYVGDRLAVCTVIGFPNGYMTTAAKVFETEDAVKIQVPLKRLKQRMLLLMVLMKLIWLSISAW